METILAAAPFVAIASGVAQAGLGVVQGIQSSQAARLEKQQFADEAAAAKLASTQEEIRARQKLEKIYALNDTIRGARGLNLITGTSEALREANLREAEADIDTIRLNAGTRVSRASYGALGAGMRETAGLFSGAGAFVSGIGNAATGALRYSGKV